MLAWGVLPYAPMLMQSPFGDNSAENSEFRLSVFEANAFLFMSVEKQKKQKLIF